MKDNNGNKWCLLCAGCNILCWIFTYLSHLIPISEFISSGLTELLSICGFVLMILIRVNYPQNEFGKILMWLYIVFTIIMIIVIVFFAIFTFWAFTSCITQCPG